MTKPWKFAVNFLTLSLLTSVNAIAGDDAHRPAKLFEDNAMMTVTMTGPWRSVDRSSDDRKWPAELVYTDATGSRHTLNIEVTKRGLTRQRVCDFPPLKLWFDKEQVKGGTFRGQSSLKMVTHCKTSRGYQKYYVKEYLSYRIYNLITDYSFRVRPMMVTYIDSERDKKPVEHFGFLIEDIDDVANRHHLEELEIGRVSHLNLDKVESSNYTLFQYMIANLDWSTLSGPDPLGCCHNTKLIGTGPDEAPVYAIPYDLDASGLVSAPYAAPPDRLPVRNLRQRLYRGFCVHNDEIPAALARFREQRQNIMALFTGNELLDSKDSMAAVKFLEGFYTTLARPANVDTLIIGKCRG